MPYFLGGQSYDANDFIAAALAGRNGNGRSRHLQKFRKELDAGLIRAALDRRRGEREFERITKFPGDGVPFRARMESDSEGRTLAAVLDGNHDGWAYGHSRPREGLAQWELFGLEQPKAMTVRAHTAPLALAGVEQAHAVWVVFSTAQMVHSDVRYLGGLAPSSG